MGKSLEGKELGKGITQRQDGRYTARYTDTAGKRIQKVFWDLTDSREWLKAELEYKERGNFNVPSQITVDAWFDYWIEIKRRTVRENTVRNYDERYKKNIQPLIGRKRLRDVNSVDCQNIMFRMADQGYKSSSLELTRNTLYNLLDYAFAYDIILKNPCNRLVKSNIGKKPTKKKALTLNEQKVFARAIENTAYELQYRFILQTGLRTGELVGLQWSDIDFGERVLSVDRTLEYRYKRGTWITGQPKSDCGYRTIPLTQEAICILQEQKARNAKIKIVDFEWKDIIFLSRDGKPVKNSTYDTYLYKICEKANIKHFSMHVLRHTFATRCIEAGMNPKTLQVILGHSTLAMTMDRYVHITDEQRAKEMDKVSNLLVV